MATRSSTIIDDYLCDEELYKAVQGLEISTAKTWGNRDPQLNRYERFERGIHLRKVEEVSIFKMNTNHLVYTYCDRPWIVQLKSLQSL